MSLAAPAALLFGLAALPLIALYILKMRRPPRVVGSTLLWVQALADTKANAPWRRLRPHLLLLLQLLAVAALVLALARPFVLQAASAPGDVVAVLDDGPLMGATDVAPSRFAEAKARIKAVVDGLAPGARMSIVLAAASPRVLTAQSTDHGALDAALDGAAVGVESPAFGPALTTALALAHGPSSTLIIYRAAGERPLPSLRGTTTVVRTVVIGGRLHDLGIAAFSLARATDGTGAALARIVNSGATPMAAAARLDIATGAPDRLIWHDDVALVPLKLARGASTTISRTRLPAATVAARVRLLRAGGSQDDLAFDDAAWAVMPAPASRRVVLVTRDNGFLALALRAIPGVTLVQQTPQTYTDASARCTSAVVYDGWLPPAAPSSRVGLLAIDPPVGAHSILGVAVAPRAPVVGLALGDDPNHLVEDAGVAAVAVARTLGLSVPFWANDDVDAQTPLTNTTALNGRTVMIDGTNGDRREVVLGLSLFDADWVLKPGFPLLVQNVLNYLAPSTANVFNPGDRIALSASPCARTITVAGAAPDGARSVLAAGDSYVAGLPGLYAVSEQPRGESPVRLFAVNGAPPHEADGATGSGGRATQPGATDAAMRPFDLSPYLAAAAVIILAAEWWVAARRR